MPGWTWQSLLTFELGGQDLLVLTVLSVLTSSLASEQVVTLQLLDQQEEEPGECSSDGAEEKPLRSSLEQPCSATAGLSPAPLSGEMKEAPKVLSEQGVGETTPLPPQALPMPQSGTQTRKEDSSEGEISSETKDSSLPSEPAGISSPRFLGPPTSIPPKPPGPITMDSECEELLADDQRAVKSNNKLGGEHVGEVAPDGPLTLDPEKGELPALDPENPGGEPQLPEHKEVEDVSSSGPPEALLDKELASAASRASLSQNQEDSQHCRCVL